MKKSLNAKSSNLKERKIYNNHELRIKRKDMRLKLLEKLLITKNQKLSG